VFRSGGGQLGYAFKWLIPTVVFAGSIIGVMYWQLGYADIPTSRLTGQLIDGFDISTEYCTFATGGTPVVRFLGCKFHCRDSHSLTLLSLCCIY
jgi:hypothetical protein